MAASMTSITVYISSHNLSGWFACVLFFLFLFVFFSIHITTAASQQHCREFLCRHHTWDFTSSIWFHRSHLAVWCHVSVEREVLRRKTDVLWSLTRMGPYFMSREGGVSTWFMVWCSVFVLRFHTFLSWQTGAESHRCALDWVWTSVSLHWWFLGVMRVMLPQPGSWKTHGEMSLRRVVTSLNGFVKKNYIYKYI